MRGTKVKKLRKSLGMRKELVNERALGRTYASYKTGNVIDAKGAKVGERSMIVGPVLRSMYKHVKKQMRKGGR